MKLTGYLLLLSMLFPANHALVQQSGIDNFIVKAGPAKSEQITIIAADADKKPLNNINGTYLFSINGFKEELKFRDGVAAPARQIDKSTFVYLKHKNDNGTHAGLYYIIKNDVNLYPVKINWVLLLVIPLLLVAFGMMFRKFIVIAIILLLGWFFFSHAKGLDLFTFLETVYNGIKSIF